MQTQVNQRLIEIKDLLNAFYEHDPTFWIDKMEDPEGDRNHDGVPFTAVRGNNIEDSLKLSHERHNNTGSYLETLERIIKNLRFEFLLLKASVAKGLTDNMMVENFETINSIILIGGLHDPELQRVYLP